MKKDEKWKVFSRAICEGFRENVELFENNKDFKKAVRDYDCSERPSRKKMKNLKERFIRRIKMEGFEIRSTGRKKTNFSAAFVLVITSQSQNAYECVLKILEGSKYVVSFEIARSIPAATADKNNERRKPRYVNNIYGRRPKRSWS
jgi:hypothetical protein